VQVLKVLSPWWYANHWLIDTQRCNVEMNGVHLSAHRYQNLRTNTRFIKRSVTINRIFRNSIVNKSYGTWLLSGITTCFYSTLLVAYSVATPQKKSITTSFQHSNQMNDRQARSQSHENRPLASSCMSVRPHVSTRLPLDGFSWNLILGTSTKICRETPNLVKIWRKYRALYTKCLYCWQRHM
jgi:hypothetical protein